MAAGLPPTQHRFTVADLAAFPEDGNRYEVIEGELYVSAAPHLAHQLAVERLTTAFAVWDPENQQGVALPGAGVIFAFDSGVIPDLVWVSAGRAAILIDSATGQPDGKLHAAPDLIVEVLSPGAANAARDREIKLKLYSRRGVSEYWIVNREAQVVELHRRGSAASLEFAATLAALDTLTSPLLPGFALPIARLFHLPAWLPR